LKEPIALRIFALLPETNVSVLTLTGLDDWINTNAIIPQGKENRATSIISIPEKESQRLENWSVTGWIPGHLTSQVH
jgi:hypothetical protein